MRNTLIVITLALAATLTGCGQQGPLYFPEDAPEAGQPQQAPLQEALPQESEGDSLQQPETSQP